MPAGATRTTLLVHGAAHGAWCWAGVVPRLTTAGYRDLAGDLPDRANTGLSGWGWTFGDDAASVVRSARLAEGPVIAVGHSRGGQVISAAAEQAPDLRTRLRD